MVIPIYNEALRSYEKTSLNQCFNVLKNYHIKFICSEGFNADSYINFSKKYRIEISIERFEPKYFANINGYNELMLSIPFYQRFNNYKYILLHQTDAYIFKDELSMWCDLDYDYIGAPWLINIREWLNSPGAYPIEILLYYKIFGKNKMNRVGNGGLSLRKTKSFISNLKYFGFWVKRWKSNEDNFFSQCIDLLNPFFKIPELSTSLKFSFDSMPEEAYSLNEFKLPFGCHAFNRNDGAYMGNKDFWTTFIPSLSDV